MMRAAQCSRCSFPQCQKGDWKADYHKGECSLLKAGRADEAERRRRLHDNGSWLHSGVMGQLPATSLTRLH